MLQKPGHPQDLVARLSRPGAFPGVPEAAEICETHISWVLLAGDRAYKLKKPVTLPFVDYSTAARRQRMCLEEVRLNRRLAPDVYLGVRAIRDTPDGLQLAAADAADAIDHVVEMRRYSGADTLAGHVRRGDVDDATLAAVGRRLAAFHATAREVLAAGAAERTARTVTENAHELLALVPPGAEAARVLALEVFLRAWLDAHGDLLAARARRGLVREGHGDLRADHVLLGDEVQVVDCLEFDVALRELDVADELAFLVMDLTARGAAEAARTIIAGYRDAGGDPGDDALVAFFAVHRALVRAKVALLRAAQLPDASPERGREHATARDLLALAERFAWQARLPLAIVLCGVPASGKSTLAVELAARSGLPHLSSDVTRKQLAGVAPTEYAGSAAYAAAVSARTYLALGRRAAAVIASGRGVLVDATFRHRADRDAFGAGFAGAAPVLFVECRVPEPELARRAQERDSGPGQVSDATLDVVLREASSFEPLDEVAAAAHVPLRADRPTDELADEVVALLDRRSGRLHAGGAAAPPPAPSRTGRATPTATRR